MKNVMDGGEAVLEAFRSLGIDYVMSSPGSEWGAVWEAFARQEVGNTTGPTYVSCAHETLAVNLAAGYAVHTGRLQAVMLHAGVGLLQGAMGIDAAQRQGVPLVIMSGESLTYGDKDGFEPGPQWQAVLSVTGGPQRLVEPFVKWANQASSVDTLFNQIVSAGEMAQRQPMGPTYLSVPIETQLAAWTPPAEPRPAAPAPVVVPEPAAIEELAAALVAAKRPAILTESAGRQRAAFDALVDLADLLAIPVCEARWADYANFPKNHELHQGYGRPELLDEADLILAVKCRAPWYPPSNRPQQATIVAIDDAPFKPHMVYNNVQVDRYLDGDVAATLRLLVNAVQAAGPDAAAVDKRRAQWTAAHDARMEAAAQLLTRTLANSAGENAIDPGLVCAALGNGLSDDTIYVDETITYRGAILNHLNWEQPQSYYRTYGGLGQAIGTALGVKFAARDRTVVALMGDGTFMYNPMLQALAFSRNQDLPVLTVIFNNGGYDAMKKEHHAFYPDGISADHDIYPGFAVTGLNYEELAVPFGGFGRRVEKAGDLEAAIADAQAALADGKSAILNVMTAATGSPLGV